MEWITNHQGPPNLISIDSSVSQSKKSQYLKTILLSGKSSSKMVYQPSQLDSPFSLMREGKIDVCQQFQFAKNQDLERRVNALFDNACLTRSSRYSENSNSIDQVEIIEHAQLSPVRQLSRFSSPWTLDYCLSDERFRFLFNETSLLEELVGEENLRSSSNEINLKNDHLSGKLSSVQVVAFSRLCRLYWSVFKPISIRLSFSDTTPVILVMNSKDAHQFTDVSTEITEIQDCTEIPFIIRDILSNSDDSSRYILLLYNANYEYWELVGCIDNIHSVESTLETSFHPTDIVSVEYENFVEASPSTAMIRDAELQFHDDTTRQHFYGNSEEMDNMLLQDRLEHGIFSCPTFTFPSVIAMIFSSISTPVIPIEEDESKEKEPEIAQMKINLQIFKCETCEKEFRHKKNLANHKVLHNPAKWKKCCDCDYKAPRSSSMKTHFAKFHSQKHV